MFLSSHKCVCIKHHDTLTLIQIRKDPNAEICMLQSYHFTCGFRLSSGSLALELELGGSYGGTGE